MKIASISENQNIEKRISVTPDIAKKYTSLGFEVLLSDKYGSHLGIKDEEYSNVGVKFSSDEKEILNNSDIIIQLGLPSDEKNSFLREGQILIGSLNSNDNKQNTPIVIKTSCANARIAPILNCHSNLNHI